ncbi:hypothetical protein OG520_41300 (plasmid) [Streptomyces sp. NBC_00984]|uniref:hypothetical protein n=1 Tax=Streptomyces sp. NBC_00984 TaxID=2903700 RepID=UPI002F910BE8|nr:hypothetical protein OG520_41300 [Streptomyces sp. NBC_00984]
MNHRYVSAAVVLTSAAALLAAAGGPSGASPNPAASTTAVSTTAGSATGSPGTPTAADAQARTKGAAAWQPCYLPTGYKHFFELESAKNVHGSIVVRVTPETCNVNTENDEDVVYTPTGAARSYVFAAGASVKVFSDIDTTTVKSVAPKWLVNHKLTNTPHFYYRLNGQRQITAMQEIYHP